MRSIKGSLSISEYLDKINVIADQLALAGSPMTEGDLVTIIMNSLGPQFEHIVSSAQARVTLITYDDLEALLLSAKRRLHEQSQPVLHVVPTALHASRPRGVGHGFPFGRRGGACGRPFLANPNTAGRNIPAAHAPGSILGLLLAILLNNMVLSILLVLFVRFSLDLVTLPSIASIELISHMRVVILVRSSLP